MTEQRPDEITPADVSNAAVSRHLAFYQTTRDVAFPDQVLSERPDPNMIPGKSGAEKIKGTRLARLRKRKPGSYLPTNGKSPQRRTHGAVFRTKARHVNGVPGKPSPARNSPRKLRKKPQETARDRKRSLEVDDGPTPIEPAFSLGDFYGPGCAPFVFYRLPRSSPRPALLLRRGFGRVERPSIDPFSFLLLPPPIAPSPFPLNLYCLSRQPVRLGRPSRNGP